VSERRCPGCGGKISRGATLCAICRKTAIVAGVNLIAPGARSAGPPPPPPARTTGQNRAYHGKCGRLARIRGVPVREIKEWALEQASTMFHREIASSKAMNEDEMSDVLDILDDAIAQAEAEA
jgi:hypothetical protein